MRYPFESARTNVLRTLLVLFAVTLVAGCGIFSPDDGGDGGDVDPPDPWQLAETKEQLAANFRRCWEDRNIIEYDNLLAENFIFRLSQDDIDQGLSEIGFWDRATEMNTADQMFGVPDNEDLTIESIQFTTWDLVTPWSDQITDEQYADAELFAEYRVALTVDFGESQETVRGRQRLYIKLEPITIDGQEVTVYRLRAWEDLGKAF